MLTMFGILNLHKPGGVTSRAVVNTVQRLLPRKTKIGHAGTLDPLATGVLVICIGPATRLVPFIHEFPKSYRATFRLGATSDTDDVTGQISERPDAAPVGRGELESALKSFQGRIQQTPPRFSAVHVDGQRAYALARAGVGLELDPKEVEIHDLRILEYEWPRLVIDMDCSSGTYVRSVARDLGERLGCGGLMTDLVRTAIGPFSIETALDPASLTRGGISAALANPLLAVPNHQAVVISAVDVADIRMGRAIRVEPFQAGWPAAAVDESGVLIALGEQREATRRFHPTTVFH
jgi:tRNA pseudouridine55 synthase